MRRATIIRKHQGRGRRTSAPAYSTTSGQIPPRTPHRMSVPSIVESLNTHRYLEHQRAKATMTRLALDDDKTMYGSSSRLTATPSSDTPPSYGSVLSQIQENSSDCEGLYDFLSRTYRVLWSTVLSTVFLVMLTALPISMIAVGSTYRNECPVEPRLPIYLLVGGSFGLIKVFLLLWNQNKNSNNACADEDDDADTEDAVVHRTTKFTGFILTVFLFVWFVMGNIWFYKIDWMPNFEQPLHEPSNWCHVIVFRYTLYQLVTCYGLLGLAVLTTTCFISYYCCKKYTYIK
ncbi:transmembrane protein 272-like [Ostrea edulis]|uniref:transmembrane protein 272-like n=1 Tax=Ostrea edulis TaxID=37623 RepID=UPI0024AED187|nr:transmembrane protein 272-like [Ostrea edulis]